jgi:hypothetical protein
MTTPLGAIIACPDFNRAFFARKRVAHLHRASRILDVSERIERRRTRIEAGELTLADAVVLVLSNYFRRLHAPSPHPVLPPIFRTPEDPAPPPQLVILLIAELDQEVAEIASQWVARNCIEPSATSAAARECIVIDRGWDGTNRCVLSFRGREMRRPPAPWHEIEAHLHHLSSDENNAFALAALPYLQAAPQAEDQKGRPHIILVHARRRTYRQVWPLVASLIAAFVCDRLRRHSVWIELDDDVLSILELVEQIQGLPALTNVSKPLRPVELLLLAQIYTHMQHPPKFDILLRMRKDAGLHVTSAVHTPRHIEKGLWPGLGNHFHYNTEALVRHIANLYLGEEFLRLKERQRLMSGCVSPVRDAESYAHAAVLVGKANILPGYAMLAQFAQTVFSDCDIFFKLALRDPTPPRDFAALIFPYETISIEERARDIWQNGLQTMGIFWRRDVVY